MSPDLDLSHLRSFVAIAEERSFTRAATRLGATQSAVSVRLQKLEADLGRRLLTRSSRRVGLTGFGAAFLSDARRVLALNDEVLARVRADDATMELRLGVSDHAVGGRLAQVARRLAAATPEARLSLTVEPSDTLLSAFEAGGYDAVVARAAPEGPTDLPLFEEALEWVASPSLAAEASRALPLIVLAEPCALRALAVAALDEAGIAWRESFRAAGVAAVQAAVSAGLGVACLDRRNRPADAVPVGERLGLPELPRSAMILRHRLTSAGQRRLVDAVAAAFRSVEAGLA